MQIYELLDNHEENSILEALSMKGKVILNSIEKSENISTWEQPYVTFFLERQTDDLMTYFDYNLFFLSHKSWKTLQPLVGSQLHVFPVKIYLRPELNYYALKPLVVQDCIDKTKSTLEVDDNGHILPEKVVLKSSKVNGLSVFRPFVGSYSPIFVSKGFKNLVEMHKLSGFYFQEVELI